MNGFSFWKCGKPSNEHGTLSHLAMYNFLMRKFSCSLHKKDNIDLGEIDYATYQKAYA